MRQGVHVLPAVPWSGGLEYAVIEVRTDRWREFWLRATEAAGTYTLEVYRTEADARAQAHRLGVGTHAAGSDEVAITPDVGAPFSVAAMSVEVRASGAIPTTLVAWTHNPAGIAVDRISALLAQYAKPNEMLAGFAVKVGHQIPGTKMKAVGVTAGSYGLEDNAQPVEQGVVQVELHAWVSRLENGDGYRDCLAAGSALVAIAREQRTWGGIAIETDVPAQPTIAVELADGGGIVYHGIVGVRLRFPDMQAQRTTTNDAPGDGGKYAAALT